MHLDKQDTKLWVFGAGGRIRTPDLLITNQLLYQLSYTSISETSSSAATFIVAERRRIVNWENKKTCNFFGKEHAKEREDPGVPLAGRPTRRTDARRRGRVPYRDGPSFLGVGRCP